MCPLSQHPQDPVPYTHSQLLMGHDEQVLQLPPEIVPFSPSRPSAMAGLCGNLTLVIGLMAKRGGRGASEQGMDFLARQDPLHHLQINKRL